MRFWVGRSSGFLKGRFGRGVFWNLVGTLFTQGSVFVTAIVLARILGKEIFGELSMIQSTLLTMTSIAQVSTGLTATKYVAEFRDSDKARAGRVLGLCSLLTFATGLLATVILLAGAPWMAERIFAAPHLDVALSISAGLVLFSVMNGYQVGALAGLESYKVISSYGVLLGGIHLAVCGIGALIGGLQGALGGMVFSALFRWAVYAMVLHREISKCGITIQRRNALQESKIVRQFALPAALSGLTGMPAIWLGNFFLVHQPDGYAQMGLYSAANNIRALMLLLPTLLNSVGLSVLNNKYGNNDGGYRSLYEWNIRVTGVIAVTGAVVMGLLSTVIPSWYGMPSNSYSTSVILILAIAIIPEALAVSAYQLVHTSGKMWSSFFLIALPRDLLMVTLAALLIPVFGGTGLAAAYGLSWLVAMTVIMVFGIRLRSQLNF